MPEAPRRKLVIVGAGGHAKVVIDLFREALPQVELVGLIDADPRPRQVCGAPVLGDDSRLPQLRADGVDLAFVALGDNRLREKLGRAAEALGFTLASVVSPAAHLSATVRLGAGVAVMAGAVINAETHIDDLAIINTGALIDHDCRIGLAAHVAPGCVLAGGVTLAPRAFLGAGVTVTPGVTIGAAAQVGAGACVVTDLQDQVLAVGVPARVTRHLKDGVHV